MRELKTLQDLLQVSEYFKTFVISAGIVPYLLQE
jgi:hypothetical protein